MTAPVQTGDILAGKYKVERVLGQGGMGVVVAALHTELDERVAIKFLQLEVLGMPEVVERFSREGRAAVKIKSEHVARVIDVGKLEDGSPFMVMEYLEGEDLASLLEKRGSLPVPEAVEYVLQACEAIAEAHALGIVHRDLKPANLFLTKRADGTPTVKVLDFGISKAPPGVTRAEAALTKTATVVGSPQYMSPEQMRSIKNVDARGDIWALGVILHELVSGQAVFSGETMPELVLKIMADEAEPLSKARPGTPRGLEAIVQRCLQKAPDKRYPSVAELALALVEFAPKRAAISVDRIRGVFEEAKKTGRSSAAPTSEGVTAASTQASWGTSKPMAGGGSKLPLAVAAALIVGIGVATFFGLRGRGDAGKHEAASAASATTVTALPRSTEPAGALVATAPPVVVPAPLTASASPAASALPAPIEPSASRVAGARLPDDGAASGPKPRSAGALPVATQAPAAPVTATPTAPQPPPPPPPPSPPPADFSTQK